MRKKVAVVFGGVSVEHEISILSAMQVLAAMPKKYEVIPLYIAKDGRMFSDPCLCELECFQDLEVVCQKACEVQLIRRGHQGVLLANKRRWFSKEQTIDIVLPILHGTNGEDGSFQGYLSTLQIPYAQCGVLAGALGQDKVAMKMVLEDRGLPLVPWFYWRKHQKCDEAFYQKAERLGYPMVVKPANLGSSIGISIVHDAQELKHAMTAAFYYDEKVVIEKMIAPLKEINVSVLGNAVSARCSVLEEVIKQDEILSFKDKYEGGAKSKGMASASRIIPASLSQKEQEELEQYALRTFEALQGEGVVRIDFLMNEESRELYVNEINSIPGSLSFYLWEHSGVSFAEVLDTILQLGSDRYRREHQRIATFDTNVLSLQAKGIKK